MAVRRGIGEWLTRLKKEDIFVDFRNPTKYIRARRTKAPRLISPSCSMSYSGRYVWPFGSREPVITGEKSPFHSPTFSRSKFHSPYSGRRPQHQILSGH